MSIVLLRHTEVQEEFIGAYNGHIDIPLSAKGQADAKKLSHKFQSMKFEKIFCSDLLRAKQTLEALQLSQDVTFTPFLREKSWGENEGKKYEEIVESSNQEYENFSQWLEVVGGESVDDFTQRVVDFFCTIEEQNVLVVTHSGVIKIVLAKLYNLTLEEAFSQTLGYGTFIEIDKKDLEQLHCFS